MDSLTATRTASATSEGHLLWKIVAIAIDRENASPTVDRPLRQEFRERILKRVVTPLEGQEVRRTLNLHEDLFCRTDIRVQTWRFYCKSRIVLAHDQ